jgi:curved DNA-binding protein CbpA
MSSELFDNINYLLKVNYDNNLLSLNEYNQIRSSLNNLSNDKLYTIFQKLKYLKDNNDSRYNISTSQLKAQQNQLIQQQNIINQQQNQINNIVNFFNNDFNLEDNLTGDDITNRFNNESNGRRSLINTQQEYLPRMNQPVMQNKQPRISFETDYQNRFQQRNDFSNTNYNSLENGSEYDDSYNQQINVFNKNDFYNQEKQREKDFEKSQKLRRKIFEESSKKRRQEFENSLQEVNDSIDPYQILNCRRGCDIEEIKKSYRKLALTHHPDRGGNPQNFQLITKAYLSLIEEYKKTQSEKDYMDLKNSSNNYMTNQENNPRQNIDMNNDNFNLKLFNKIYMENRLSDPNDEGYNNWYKDNEEEEEEDQPKIFSDKFNINVFNSVFENSKNSQNTQDIVEYKDPTPTNLNNELSYNNLGEGHINDFSGNSNNLNYTDLKYAHTKTKLIDTRNVNIKSYQNVEELEKDRSNINYNMSQDDIVEHELRKKREELNELERQQRVKSNDNKHFDNYDKVHKILIGNK